MALARVYGADAVRYWLLREMPRSADDDFTVARLIAVANRDLANDLGNLINRVVSMVGHYREGRVPIPADRSPASEELRRIAAGIPAKVAEAIHHFDFRTALEAIWILVGAANRTIDARQPWTLARAARRRCRGRPRPRCDPG